MDHHLVAAVSIAGTGLDLLGSLYLAYDLLGGQHGPLRLLTRAVTYSIIFGVGYGLGLGLWFGVVSGLATGITISMEFNRASRGLEHYSLPWEAWFSAVRGAAFGVGLAPTLGVRFAIAFGTHITLGTVLAYFRGMRPASTTWHPAEPALRAANSLGRLRELWVILPPRSSAMPWCIEWTTLGSL